MAERNDGTEWRNGMAERNGGSGMGIKRGMAEAEWGIKRGMGIKRGNEDKTRNWRLNQQLLRVSVMDII